MQEGAGHNCIWGSECHPFSSFGEHPTAERCSVTPEWTFQLREHLNLALLRAVTHTTDCQNSHRKLSLHHRDSLLSKHFSAEEKKRFTVFLSLGFVVFLGFFYQGVGCLGCLMEVTNVTELISVSPCLKLMITKSTFNLCTILQFRFAKGHELCTAKKLLSK